MDPAINVNLKNDKQSAMSSKPIHSEKVQAPVDFAISKRSAKTYVNCVWTVEQGKYLLHWCFPSVSEHYGAVMIKFNFL